MLHVSHTTCLSRTRMEPAFLLSLLGQWKVLGCHNLSMEATIRNHRSRQKIGFDGTMICKLTEHLFLNNDSYHIMILIVFTSIVYCSSVINLIIITLTIIIIIILYNYCDDDDDDLASLRFVTSQSLVEAPGF